MLTFTDQNINFHQTYDGLKGEILLIKIDREERERERTRKRTIVQSSDAMRLPRVSTEIPNRVNHVEQAKAIGKVYNDII